MSKPLRALQICIPIQNAKLSLSMLQVVTNPIDLLKIQQKLKTDEYEDIDALQTDIELLVNNAKAFYKVLFSIHV